MSTGTSTKKVDNRIRTIIEKAARNKHRAFILLVGDEGKTQIVNLHYMLTKARNETNLNVLWCMKSELAFGGSSNKKRLAQSRREISTGKISSTTHESFEAFLSNTNIRYNYYKESHKVLGNTFDMVILQDFEALQPNVLARTVETAAGGGLVVLMLRTMTSLKQLYTMTMDIHARYRSDQHQVVTPRFNERFLLSFADCDNFVCVDDELNVLPITYRISNLSKPTKQESRIDGVGSVLTQQEKDLMELKEKLNTVPLIGPLVRITSTSDQAKMVMTLVNVIGEKTLKTTVGITAGRGRGKSAALGLAVASAVQSGYSNIFVTSPSPENLITFFEFVVKGLKGLGYVERADFDVQYSALPELKHCPIRIQIHKSHRQTVQYIFPQDSQNFAQAELLVIDEAAAIPLPFVQRMLGPYLIFISSTVSGYEGTGRSLSLKLFQELKKSSSGGTSDRTFKELELKQPIRYASGDPIELWLHRVLCLEATMESYTPTTTPHPSQCNLFYLNRDALFSYHQTAEEMLQRAMSLLVAAHYKNQPNDLQLLSDAPAHHLFALIGPFSKENPSELPDVYCVIQVCEEGNISAQRVQEHLGSATKPSGDIIPYTLASNFLSPDVAAWKGLRIVRIATHPKMQKCGYGTRALQELINFIQTRGPIASGSTSHPSNTGNEDDDGTTFAPRQNIPVLLQSLTSQAFYFPPVEYLGTIFGATTPLVQFWQKAGLSSQYIRQQPNETTGEHSLLMIRSIGAPGNPISQRIHAYHNEFQKRLLSLMGNASFRAMPLDLLFCLGLEIPTHNPLLFEKYVGVNDHGETTVDGITQASSKDVLNENVLTQSDVERLRAFTQLRTDIAVILDLVPTLARLYFSKRLFRQVNGGEGVLLSPPQALVLLAVGLHGIGGAFEELPKSSPIFSNIPVTQIRAFFAKAVGLIVEHILKLTAMAEETPLAGTEQEEIIEVGGEGEKKRVKRLQVSRVQETGKKVKSKQ